MQVNHTTREVYASSPNKANQVETIDLMTVAPRSYDVVCWDAEGYARWSREFGSDLSAAVVEYNRWAATPETVPTFD